MGKWLFMMLMGVLLLESLVAPIAYGAERLLEPKLVFEIGGKAKIKRRRNTVIPVGGGIRWHNNLMCGEFDMSLSVTNLLNGVTGKLQRLGDDLIASVTGVISSLPMMAIARADPQLYEFLQQGKLEASELFNASVASCEEVTDRMIAGDTDALSYWIEASGHEDWMVGASEKEAGDTDVVSLEEEINRNKGDGGITWVDAKKRGGKGQPPIEIEKDAITVGYNKLANRNPVSKKLLEVSEEAPWYAEYWGSPDDAEKWITSVIGTTTLRTCQNCERLSTTPGKGVYPKLEEEQRHLEKTLIKLLELPVVVYEVEQLKEISAPGYEVTQQLMEGLKSENIYRRALIERLAEEIAIANMVERLIAARRILLSGSREAHIAQNPESVKILDARINEISEEMQLLRQDEELRATTRTSVAVTILERMRGRQNYNAVKQLDDVRKAVRSITGRNG